MWKCPVCNTINEDNICCKNCGLDQSRNYTACRTFYPLSLDAASDFEKEKKRSAEKLRRGDSKLIQEIAAAVRKAGGTVRCDQKSGRGASLYGKAGKNTGFHTKL